MAGRARRNGEVEHLGGEVDQFWAFVRAIATSAVLFIPLYVIYKRISAAKVQELSNIDRGLAGEEGALSGSMIGDQAAAMTAFELLQYKELVHRMWVWPIGPQIQKIVLIGLVPPVTWVLAALVEVYLSAAIE